jgi:predicted RNA binding protein YcfA (HicA-like mRNA interferase family)
MPRLPVVKPKIVIRALKRAGFDVHHTTGSHYFLKKDNLRVSVPYHNKDLKPGRWLRLLRKQVSQLKSS